MSTLNQVRQWFEGKLEITCVITYTDRSGADGNPQVNQLTKKWVVKAPDLKDCGLFPGCETIWYDLDNVEVITWQDEYHGRAMHYMWIEEDGGNEIKHQINFNNEYQTDDPDDPEEETTTIQIQTNIKISERDDLLGESIVEYCDQTTDEGEQYNTGKLKFNIHQHE